MSIFELYFKSEKCLFFHKSYGNNNNNNNSIYQNQIYKDKCNYNKTDNNISTIDHKYLTFWFKDNLIYLGSSHCKVNIFRVEHTIKLL